MRCRYPTPWFLLLVLVLMAALVPACGPGGPAAETRVTVEMTSEPVQATERKSTEPPAATDATTLEPTDSMGGATMTFSLSSTAFEHEATIPERYTCDDQDLSPALSWSDIPQGTAALALVMEDPDAPAGTWVHWVLFNIPASVAMLEEAVPDEERLPSGAVHGQNSWGDLGYGGPCPPSGTHRYFFRLYALDTNLDLGPGATKEQVLIAMQGHVLSEAELMGRYAR